MQTEWATCCDDRRAGFGSLVDSKNIHPISNFHIEPVVTTARAAAKSAFSRILHLSQFRTTKLDEHFSRSVVGFVVATEVAWIMKRQVERRL